MTAPITMIDSPAGPHERPMPSVGRCYQCGKRDGRLDTLGPYDPMPHLGIHHRWTARFHFCRYCRAANTRSMRRIFGDDRRHA